MMKRALILVLFVLTFYGWIFAEDAIQEFTFDGEQAKQYVAYLSSDAMEGRMSGTEGYRKAADWVASKFKAWGLQPAGENGTYFQKVTIPPFIWQTGVPSLKVGSRDFPFDDGDYALHPVSTTGTRLKRDIVFVGYGIAAAEKGLDEYSGVDVRDRIVLALKGSPKNAPPVRGFFERPETTEKEQAGDDWQAESTDWRKIRTAHDHHAAAILLYDPERPEIQRHQPPRESEPDSLEPKRNFLCFTINERIFRAIMKQDPQESPQGLKSRMDRLRRNIKGKKPESLATGAQAVLQGYQELIPHDAAHGNNTARNVLAKIEGTDPKLKNEYVFVGAHLDHIGIRDGYIYNGADDNASGSAVVLELARVLSESRFQPKRTLLFCCWCAEERGLIGSLHYTNHPCDDVTMDRIVACFNLDMPGMGEDLQASGGLNFPSIWEVIVRGLDPEILRHVKPGKGGGGGSDHAGFTRVGIESMLLIGGGGGGHPDYHQPEDDAAKIDPAMLRLAGQFVLNGMKNLANETEVNLLIPRRLELYRALRMRIRNFNPELEGSQWTQVTFEQRTPEALEDAVCKRARELFRGETAAGGREEQPQRSNPAMRGRQSPARGTADLAIVRDDTRLLKLAIDYYQIGRFDIHGDDGVWIAEGRLTEMGKSAIQVLEESGVVARLVSPSEELIRDMLSTGSKPFIVTGDYTIPNSMTDSLNARGVLLGVNLDPKQVPDFLDRVEKMKTQLGQRKNLFAYLTSLEALDEAKQPLYLGLVDRGWTHHEIVGTREHRGLFGGASLSGLTDGDHRSP